MYAIRETFDPMVIGRESELTAKQAKSKNFCSKFSQCIEEGDHIPTVEEGEAVPIPRSSSVIKKVNWEAIASSTVFEEG